MVYRRQPSDERGDEEEEGGRIHLTKGDSAAAQLNHGLDQDEAREHHGGARVALRDDSTGWGGACEYRWDAPARHNTSGGPRVNTGGAHLRLGVALAALHKGVGDEGADERERGVEKAHKGDDPHRASDGLRGANAH